MGTEPYVGSNPSSGSQELHVNQVVKVSRVTVEKDKNTVTLL